VSWSWCCGHITGAPFSFDEREAGPPIDEVVEVSCCGHEFWARFLPERNSYLCYITKADARSGAGIPGRLGSGHDESHLPEHWRPARLGRAMADPLEDHKNAVRKEKAMTSYASGLAAEAQQYFRKKVGREMRGNDYCERDSDGNWVIHLDDTPTVVPLPRRQPQTIIDR